MQRCREHIVKLIQITGCKQAFSVEQARMLRPFGQSLGLHAAQEHARVHLPVKTLSNRRSAECQIQRRTNRGHRIGMRFGLGTMLSSPSHQGIATQ